MIRGPQASGFRLQRSRRAAPLFTRQLTVHRASGQHALCGDRVCGPREGHRAPTEEPQLRLQPSTSTPDLALDLTLGLHLESKRKSGVRAKAKAKSKSGSKSKSKSRTLGVSRGARRARAGRVLLRAWPAASQRRARAPQLRNLQSVRDRTEARGLRSEARLPLRKSR